MSHLVVCLCSNGNLRSFQIDHTKIQLYFDSKDISFCGAIDDCNIIAVSSIENLENNAQSVLNVYCREFPHFFENVYGDILLVGSDSGGNAIDVNIVKVLSALNKNNTQ